MSHFLPEELGNEMGAERVADKADRGELLLLPRWNEGWDARPREAFAWGLLGNGEARKAADARADLL